MMAALFKRVTSIAPMPLTSQEPQRRHLISLSAHGFHRVTYYEWGAPDNPRVVICVHGLTRNGRDFDVLGEALAPTHRVLAIDMPGRGQSEWLADPLDYAFSTYLATLTALIARTAVERVQWVGTSMGGLLGMVLAAQRGSPIERMVVNDVGAALEVTALARIAAYVGADPTFTSYEDIAHYIRTVSAPFGNLDPAQWEHLTHSSVGRRPDGRWGLLYDPAISVVIKAAPAPPDLWSMWDAIRCPTLLLRGGDSDLLAADTARVMTERGPKPRLIEFEGVGHAPALLAPDQVAPIVEFLRD